MPITDRQRELRKGTLGSSDVPAILGMSPFKTPYDIWLLKTGRVEDTREAEVMDIGNMIEDGLLRWASHQTGIRIVRNQRRVHENGILHANIDALGQDKPVGFEAKTSGILGRAPARDQWGEDGTDMVPDYVRAQAVTQMVVAGLECVYVPALIGSMGRRLYRVHADEDTRTDLLGFCTDWWHRYVIGDTPPEDSAPSLDVIKKIERQPGQEVTIPDDVILRWINAKEAAKSADVEQEAAEIEVRKALGEAVVGLSGMGTISMKQITQNRIDAEALRTEQPDVAAAYTKPSSYWRMNFKGVK